MHFDESVPELEDVLDDNLINFNDFISSLNANSNNFSLVHFNIRSLTKHFDELQQLLSLTNSSVPHIICLVETYTNGDSIKHLQIPNYSFEMQSRTRNTKGGAAMYISNAIKYCLRTDLQKSLINVESVWIELMNVKSK